VRRFLFTLLVLLIAGCGGSESSDLSATTTGQTPLKTTGTILVRHTLARAVAAEVTHYRFAGLDAEGKVTFGPTDHPKAAEVKLEVPLSTRMLNIEYLNGEKKVGSFQAEVTPTVTPSYIVEDPGWARGKNIQISPVSFRFLPNAFGQLRTYGSTGIPVSPIYAAYFPLLLEQDGSFQATSLAAGGAVLAAFDNEKTLATGLLIRESDVRDLSLPDHVKATVGTTLTTLVPNVTTNTGSEPIFGGTWSSSDPAVATIDRAGNVTALSKGATTVSVTINGRTATTRVDVVDPYVLGIRIIPGDETLPDSINDPNYGYVDFSAEAVFSDLHSEDVTDQTQFSSPPDSRLQRLFTFNRFYATEPGAAEVTAQWRSFSTTTTVWIPY
jgi:hypothetical protein